MKVFSIEKFVKDTESTEPGLSKDFLEAGWPYEIEGKTSEEIEEMGYSTHPDWMEEYPNWLEGQD